MSLLMMGLLVAFLATVFSLAGGLGSMVARGEAGHHSSEQWMMLRIGFQALAVVLVLMMVFAG